MEKYSEQYTQEYGKQRKYVNSPLEVKNAPVFDTIKYLKLS